MGLHMASSGGKKLTDEETPGNRGLSLYSRVFFVNKVHRKHED